jgi:hypothetical protein
MNAIYKFVLGLIGKRSGVVTTLPSQKQIEFQVNMLTEKFMRNGIEPNSLKSPEQVKNVLANIDQANIRVIPADSAEGASIARKLGIAKKADVMDMEGNKISDGAKIMGGKEVKESDAAIKARLDASNKKGIAGIKINLVDDSIARIKSLEPIEAMKEANLVAGKKGRYANLDDNQVKKIIDDTNDHIFERDIPDEDFATGGRVGLKGGTFLNFIKNMTMNKKSPYQFGKDYLKNVKDKTLRANETGKFMDLPLAEVGIPAASGALVNNQIRKKLKAMNEEQKEEQLKNFIMELENDEFYQKYPDLKDETIASYTEKLFGVKKADGGRIGLRGGGQDAGRSDFKSTNTNSPGHPSNRTTNPSTNKATVGPGGDGPQGPPRVINPPPTGSDPDGLRKAPVINPRLATNNDFMKFNKQDLINLGLVDSEEEENIKLAKVFNTKEDLIGLGAAKDSYFDTLTPKGEALEKFRKNATSMNNPTGTFQEYKGLGAESQLDTLIGKGNKNATENEAVIRDALEKGFLENESDFINQKPLKKAFADGGRIGLKAGSVDKMRRLILKAIGAGTAGIAGAKSGIFSGFGKGAGKTVAKEVAQQSTSSMPPPYFFKLAEKIKKLGDDVTATTDRTIAKSLKSKDGKSEYFLEEDVSTGDTIIKKINKEGDEMITDVEIMELKKGETVMGKDGKGIKIADEYEEVTEANARIEGDAFNDPYYTDGINVDEIIKEVDDKIPSIKYASGGLAYMLGE